MKILIYTSLLFLVASNFGFAQDSYKWTNSEGKTIEAEFVSVVDGKLNLRVKNQSYQLFLSNLSKESEAKAEELNRQQILWVKSVVDLPIIKEVDLLKLLRVSPKLAEGKSYLIIGFVDRIRNSSSLSRNAGVEISLSGGTRFSTNFDHETDARRKVSTESERVVLLKARTLASTKGWKNYSYEKTLLEINQKIHVKGRISKGDIIFGSIADEREVSAAKLSHVRLTKGVEASLNLARAQEIQAEIDAIDEMLESGVSATVRIGGRSITSIDGRARIQSSTATVPLTEAEKSVLEAKRVRLLTELESLMATSNRKPPNEVGKQFDTLSLTGRWRWIVKRPDGSKGEGVRRFKSGGIHYWNSNPEPDGKWNLEGRKLKVITHGGSAVATFDLDKIKKEYTGSYSSSDQSHINNARIIMQKRDK